MSSGDRLLLLDTASLYFRAFFGVPDSVTAPDGTPVNAVRGLMDFISRLVGEYDPSHLACCWDDDWRPQWRVDLIPSYKSHRVVREVPGPRPDVEEVPDPLQAQVPIIISVLEAFGIPVVGHAEMEADDVIGTLATGAGMPVDIVTGDRDLFQLVDDDAQVRVLYVARGVSKHERVDNAWVRGKYGVDAHQYADLATLRGDASDGLPGVAGVGDKTAATLLGRFGTVEAIVAAAADPDSDMGPGPRGKIKAAADYLLVAPRVVAVRRDLDLGSPDLTRPRTPVDHDAVVALDERWGLGSSAVRLVQAMSGSD
ncbi:5'-3' exonuclease [Nocardioides sp. zg-1308]|uniref:5'-3' exonuclease n=1 Tax=Nocardioides renjunii TaxID=3095075 RepID=A0ABU5KBX5_9ACTN|nr:MULTISPECIES: 5'-3' exonuclease [unclassified Nocardioides]MDZ5662075.1 5'-3' exonuclease [Nocardioides sp. S-58]NPD06217.1 5'-3' exonuclease [Nocardioides sp. zg-1308]WQQ24314.1 5'-3' exonuclease [Nocardioides sp. S-34]